MENIFTVISTNAAKVGKWLIMAVTLTVTALFGFQTLSEETVKMVEIAGWYITDQEAQTIKSGFAEKGEGLGQAGEVEARREIILSQTYTDGEKNSMVVYNFTNDKYFVVPAKLYDTYLADDNFRKLGAPVSKFKTINLSGKTIDGKVKAGTYKAQVYEKGVLLFDGNSVKMYVGAVESTDGGIILHPFISDQDLMIKSADQMVRFEGIDGEMHPLKEAIVTRTKNGGYKLYANYSSCCVYLEYNSNYTLKSQLISAGKNYIKNEKGSYVATILPIECISTYDMVKDGSEPVEADALTYYQQKRPLGNADAIVEKFADAYEDLYKDGYVAGYRCSKIKMWTYMVLDLRFGDGTTGFDEIGSGGRERMTCLVYNPDRNKVYPVSDTFFTIWKDDGDTGRNVLGCPTGNILNNTVINGKTYDKVQKFQNGTICLTSEGNYYVYDGGNNLILASKQDSQQQETTQQETTQQETTQQQTQEQTTQSTTQQVQSGAPTVTATSAQMTKIAGYKVSESDAKTIISGFAENGNGLGVGEKIEARREIILTQIFAKEGKSSMVVYNFSDKKYYTVPNELIDAYLVDDSFRKLGAPVGNMSQISVSGSATTGKIKSGTYTAQLYEKGVLLLEGESVKMYVGAVEKTNSGVVIHPIIDDQDIYVNIEGKMARFEGVDGELHPLKEIVFSRKGDGYELYANYSSCCVYLSLGSDYSVKKQLISAGKNYIGTKTKQLPIECINVEDMICDGETPVEAAAMEYYKKYKPNASEQDLIAKFAESYKELYNNGYVAGYRCSQIKMWTHLVLDLRFGDGKTGFDETGSGGRERITCLVYNPVQDKVYAVKDSYFTIWKEDGGNARNILGYPEANVEYNKTINGKTFEEIQIFQSGYIYLTQDGNYHTVAGSAYKGEGEGFTASPTPMIPDRFGNEVGRAVKDTSVYINYEKGAIRCDLTYNGARYLYTFFCGRNFNLESSNFEVSMLPMDKLVDLNSLTCEGTMPTRNGAEVSFNDVIKSKLIAKYTELYNSGYFCGFPEEVFKGAWNNVYAQQFVVSDSRSMIFGEERPYVCALVYNPKTDSVYLMRDDVIKTWQSVYATAGSPTSDEYQVAGCDMWFQTFDFGMTIRNGNLIVFTEDFDSPESYVSEMQSNPLSVPTHGRDVTKGYIA